MSRRRRLSDEEEALWGGVTRSIKPLRPAKSTVRPVPTRDQEIFSLPRAASPQHTPKPPRSPPLAPFDRRLKQRVARGREEIGARIDLHGMTQSEAHAALVRFLRRAQADGARMALVVTGKGTGRTGGDSERGVLKRQVPLWLALPEFRLLIVGFEDAHVGHGGQGALYVRLRRAR